MSKTILLVIMLLPYLAMAKDYYKVVDNIYWQHLKVKPNMIKPDLFKQDIFFVYNEHIAYQWNIELGHDINAYNYQGAGITEFVYTYKDANGRLIYVTNYLATNQKDSDGARKLHPNWVQIFAVYGGKYNKTIAENMGNGKAYTYKLQPPHVYDNEGLNDAIYRTVRYHRPRSDSTLKTYMIYYNEENIHNGKLLLDWKDGELVATTRTKKSSEVKQIKKPVKSPSSKNNAGITIVYRNEYY